jgi:hypothetical protein
MAAPAAERGEVSAMKRFSSLLRAVVGAGAPLRCVHCRQLRTGTTRYVAGPGIYICPTCADDAVRRLDQVPSPASVRACSFCGGTALSLDLGADRRHAICVRCVHLVRELLADAARGLRAT